MQKITRLPDVPRDHIQQTVESPRGTGREDQFPDDCHHGHREHNGHKEQRAKNGHAFERLIQGQCHGQRQGGLQWDDNHSEQAVVNQCLAERFIGENPAKLFQTHEPRGQR